MAYREFRDGSGTRWTVWDTYPQPDHWTGLAALQEGWLTFEAGGDRRRLIPAPVGWVDETEERLRDWLSAAQTAKPRLAEYEARTAAAAIPVHRDDPETSGARLEVPSPPEDVRSLIQRSRQTLDDLDRAIDGQFGGFGDPPARRGD